MVIWTRTTVLEAGTAASASASELVAAAAGRKGVLIPKIPKKTAGAEAATGRTTPTVAWLRWGIRDNGSGQGAEVGVSGAVIRRASKARGSAKNGEGRRACGKTGLHVKLATEPWTGEREEDGGSGDGGRRCAKRVDA